MSIINIIMHMCAYGCFCERDLFVSFRNDNCIVHLENCIMKRTSLNTKQATDKKIIQTVIEDRPL